jgi:predicted dehydrogenase
MPKRARVAVLGCGHWGSNIIRNLSQLEALAAVVDPSPRGAEAARRIAPAIPFFSDPRPVLSDPTIHGVMIATPAETHHALAARALEAGKDVFVEKPLTLDAAEAYDLIARAETQERILMVGHLLSYHPAIVKLRELVLRGDLGKLRYVISNRLNLGKIRTEESALWSFAPHDIAVILGLVGTMPFEVTATGGCYVQPNVADVTVTQLLFDNGVRSHIFVSWLHPFKEQKLVVIGSKRMASYDDVTKQLLLYDLRVDWREGQPIPVGAPAAETRFPHEEPLRVECEHFLECIAMRKEPHTSGWDGLRVVQILQASQRSMVTNGRPVVLAGELEAASTALTEFRSKDSAQPQHPSRGPTDWATSR